MDNLIARVKAVIVKNKTRRALFTEIGSPPEPIVTRELVQCQWHLGPGDKGSSEQ